MVACAVSTGDCGQETMRRWIRLPLCAPCARIRLRQHGAGGASADPAPPSSRVDPARVKTMGRRQDGGNLRGDELVLRHPWSSGGHPWRRRHQACLSPSFPFSSSSPAEGVATARCFRSQSGNHREPPFFHSTDPEGEESCQYQQHHQSIIFPGFGWTSSCYLISPMYYCIICV
uniref:Uncharacterized protein n=1 Tax=Oryza meridionalis TaxID=40149 RepID=A0A0E0E860_9ORYZ